MEEQEFKVMFQFDDETPTQVGSVKQGDIFSIEMRPFKKIESGDLAGPDQPSITFSNKNQDKTFKLYISE